MDISIRKHGKVQVMHLKGDFRLGEAVNAFTAATEEMLLAGEAHFALDMELVGMLDSSGIGALMKLQTSATKRGGGVCLINPSVFAARTLKLVGLLALFGVFESEDQAVASLG